jgi:hypothetical protein
MTANPQASGAQVAPPRRWGAGRVVALVIGILLLLPAIGLLVGGGTLLWVDRTHRTGGYLMSGGGSFTSTGFALTSEQISLSTGTSWVPLSTALGTTRVQVIGANPDKAVFVGIAPVASGNSYLGAVRRTVVKDIGSPYGASAQVSVAGGAPAGPPGDQTFWVAQATGTGPQQLTWSPSEGDWMLVVMNADGSAGVAVQARIGATTPGLTGIAWGLIGGGLFLAVVGVLLIVLASRRPGRPAGPPVGPAPSPAGPPVAWAPPEPRPTSEAAAPDPARSRPPAPGEPSR